MPNKVKLEQVSRPHHELIPCCKDTLNKSYELITKANTQYFSDCVRGPLYRYCRISQHVLDEVDGNYVMLLKPHDMNDLYECSAFFVNGDSTAIQTFAGRELLIRCFSEVNDSILMWSHYANSNKGICIEYDIEDIREHFYKVMYLEHPLQISESLQSEFNPGFDYRLLSAVSKSVEWSYEKEWRLISNPAVVRGMNIKVRLPIKAVYFGSKFGYDSMDQTQEQRNLNLRFRNLLIERSIPRFVSKITSNEFSIVFDEIDDNGLKKTDIG